VAPAYGPLDFIPVVGEAFRISFVLNTGAAFGLLPGYQPIFIATSLVVLIVVGAYWRRARPTAWPVVIALGLVAGGAVGNLIDRAFVGRVTDFLDAAIIDFPVFNVADMAIIGGTAILVVWLLFAPQPEAEHAGSAANDEHPVESSAVEKCDSERMQDGDDG
jgi:signal peptidase II